MFDNAEGVSMYHTQIAMSNKYKIKGGTVRIDNVNKLVVTVDQYKQFIFNNKATCVLSLDLGNTQHAVNLHSVKWGFRNATFGIRKYAVLQNIRVWDPAVWKSVSANKHQITRSTWFLSNCNENKHNATHVNYRKRPCFIRMSYGV